MPGAVEFLQLLATLSRFRPLRKGCGTIVSPALDGSTRNV